MYHTRIDIAAKTRTEINRLLQASLATDDDRVLQARVASFHSSLVPPAVRHFLAADAANLTTSANVIGLGGLK